MKTYTIKPLVWTTINGDAWSETLLGTITLGWLCYKCYIWLPEWITDEIENVEFDTLEAAKLAAERWYITQIEQALTEQGE